MDGAPHAAQDSIAGASAIADQIGGTAGRALQHAANLAFVDGMQIAMLVAAGVTIVGAMIALVLLPARATDAAPAPHTVAEPVAA